MRDATRRGANLLENLAFIMPFVEPIKQMKYQPIYLPATENEVITPIFNGLKAAEDWIKAKCRKCPIHGKGKLCISCDAEWTIDQFGIEEMIGMIIEDLQRRSKNLQLTSPQLGIWFFQLAPNLNDNGQLEEWRATIERGQDLDNILYGENYFGATPEEALTKLLSKLQSNR